MSIINFIFQSHSKRLAPGKTTTAAADRTESRDSPHFAGLSPGDAFAPAPCHETPKNRDSASQHKGNPSKDAEGRLAGLAGQTVRNAAFPATRAWA
jgi:hypothetical protein